jgi:hypothetical protein
MRSTAITALICFCLFAGGCQRTSPVAVAVESPVDVTAESIVGRWRAVPKDVANAESANRDVRTPTGETVAIRYEFRDDHSCHFSSEITGGALGKLLDGKHAVPAKWKVTSVQGNTLLFVLTDSHNPEIELPPVKVIFQDRDRCLFGADTNEPVVLTRIP